jgi:hypothetical protein
VEQELLPLPEYLGSPPVFSVVRVTRSLVLCVHFVDRCFFLLSFLLAIVLFALLRFTDSDYPFGIFKLFLDHQVICMTSGAGTPYTSGLHEFTPAFSDVRVARS